MPPEVTLQIEFALRLVVAAALGAAIGLEREIHAHPAGMRTHLLVSEGSAIFTVLSIYGFVGLLGPVEGSAPDPTRIAAQIVSGIGFLGAGAILKSGTSVRGLTTAASLWATAAVGMAIGAGQYAVGGVGTLIVLFSLWPLNKVADRLQAAGRAPSVRLRLQLRGVDLLGAITRELTSRRIETTGVATSRTGTGYEIELELRVRSGSDLADAIQAVGKLPGVEILETSPPD
jgi:putative Mg2+ transporter-C (MgtC) family protein